MRKAGIKTQSLWSDHMPGSVYYYPSMAANATPIKEQIFGEAFINGAYHAFSPQKIRQALQKIGTKADITNLLKKDIAEFIKKYAIDMTDYAHEEPSYYKNFDEFFYRPLKAGVRKIDIRSTVVCSPADCKLRALQNITSSSKFFIKQKPFNLVQFLNSQELADRYQRGSLLVFRLAPTDYHRFHFPFDCVPSKPEIISGEYETVNPIAFRAGLWPISINKRARISLESPEFGRVIMIVVGASMVGSLNFTYEPQKSVKKGSEAGYFAFGGSTVCLLFAHGTINLPDILIQRSTNVKTGQKSNKKTAGYEKEMAFESAVRVGQGVAMKAGSTTINLLSSPAYVLFLNKTNRATHLDLPETAIDFIFNI
jgi:phosphatidylserine decarboxylase